MSDDITQQGPIDERYDLVGVRALAEYTTEALTRLLERGRRERCAAGQSEAGAYAAAELLGQFAQRSAGRAESAGRSGWSVRSTPLESPTRGDPANEVDSAFATGSGNWNRPRRNAPISRTNRSQSSIQLEPATHQRDVTSPVQPSGT
jgi:hypothetical protein